MKDLRNILILFLVYLFFAAPLIGRPLVTDEVAMAQAAGVRWSFGDSGPGGHPPLYIDTLRFISQSFGMQDKGLRAIGMVCFLFNLIIIYELCKELFMNKRVGLLAGLIFSTHPMAIQGSMILDIDNTVLTVLLMAAILYFIRNARTLNLKSGVFLSLLLFLGLWAKLSSPLILMVSFGVFYILKKDRIGCGKIVIIGLGAVLVFLLMWKIDTLVFDFPFTTVLGRIRGVGLRGLSGVSVPRSQELFLRILRVSLWVGPYMMLFWAIIMVRRFKEVFLKKKDAGYGDLLLIYSAGIFCAYTLFGGLSFGFAKYQYPLLPVLAVLIASTMPGQDLQGEKRYGKIYFAISVVLVLLNILVMADPVYQINYALRKISIFYPHLLKGFLTSLSARLALGLFLFLLAALAARKLTRDKGFLRPVYFLSLIFIILGNCFTDIRLWGAPFFTAYCYGRDIGEFKKVSRLCKDIAKIDKGVKIIAPEDILYDSGIPVAIGYEELWNDRDKFLRVIKDKEIGVIIYGFAYNAIFSYRYIFFDPAVSAALSDGFARELIGEYTVWKRR